MDILTQGLAASLLGQSAAVAEPRALRLAAAVGFVAGLLPDMDIFIRSDADPLLQLEYHRQFSHSLLAAPAGGLLLAAALWLLPALRRGPLGFPRLALCATLGWLSAGLLDACTSYGTHLLWPFSTQPTAWNLIAIVDPLFTLLLLTGALIAWRRRRVAAARLTLALALGYLALGALQRERAETRIDVLADARGHVIETGVVKPTLGNLILWRSVYRAEGRYHVDAVRVGLGARVFAGGSLPVLQPERDFPSLAPDSRLHRDLRRFANFSAGFLVRHPSRPGVVGDLRYAMLPDSVEPLWGIRVDPAQAQRHAPFEHYRSFDRDDRQRFVRMLLGG